VNVIGIRLHGTIGDVILASCAFRPILQKHPDETIITVSTCTRAPRLVKELISGISRVGENFYYLSIPNRSVSPLIRREWDFFRQKGCKLIYDLFTFGQGVWDGKFFRRLHRNITFDGLPLVSPLGRQEKELKSVAIYRYSKMHDHFPSRNLHISRWDWIMEQFLKRRWKIYLLGVPEEDNFPVPKTAEDCRGLPLLDSLAIIKKCCLFVGPISGLWHWARFWCKAIGFGPQPMINEINSVWFPGKVVWSKKNSVLLLPEQYLLMKKHA